MALVKTANQNCCTIVSAELNSHHDIREVSVTLSTKVCDTFYSLKKKLFFFLVDEILFHSSSQKQTSLRFATKERLTI